MTPAKLNLECPQGSTFKRTFTYKVNGVAVNLTGYTARMQVRKYYGDSTVLANATCTVTGATGVVDVVVSATASAAMPAGKWVYDLEIESAGGEVTRLLQGKFIVTPEVTK